MTASTSTGPNHADQQAARHALALMDLTSLNDSDTDATIEALCQQLKTPYGNPAAVCVYPQFIVTAQRALTAHKLNELVKIATVTNFPNGGEDIMAAARETRDAVARALMKLMWFSLTAHSSRATKRQALSWLKCAKRLVRVRPC